MHLSLQTLLIVTMSPAAIKLTEAFGLSSTVWVNLCAISFGIFAVPASFLSIWAFKNYPTSLVLRLASLLMFVGALVRTTGFRYGKFWPILVGTAMCAVAGPFFLNVTSVIANKWFSDKERALATAI